MNLSRCQLGIWNRNKCIATAFIATSLSRHWGAQPAPNSALQVKCQSSLTPKLRLRRTNDRYSYSCDAASLGHSYRYAPTVILGDKLPIPLCTSARKIFQCEDFVVSRSHREKRERPESVGRLSIRRLR